MTIEQVKNILNPESVAIYGASNDITKWAGGLMHQLLRHGWKGSVFPIHPKLTDIQGHKAYSSISAIPQKVDLACVAVPQTRVSQVISECADAGVGACLVISSNFAESGPEGAQRQKDLVNMARQKNMRLIGPNCMGIVNTHAEFSLCSSVAAEFYDYTPKGSIGIASQSGALLGTMHARAYACGTGISSGVSVGNQADLEICDFFEYLIEDDATEIICLYVEGFISPQRFLDLCRASIAKGKPVLLVKAGRSDKGASAVQSHTGSLAGEYQSLAAACEQAGAVMLNDIIDMIDVAIGWVNHGPWKTGGIAVMTGSGGGGALALDALDGVGLPIAELTEDTQRTLSEYTKEAHAQMPLDIGVIAANSRPDELRDRLKKGMTAVFNDINVGAGIYLMTTQKYAEVCTELVLELSKTRKKPLILVNLASETGTSTAQAIKEHGFLQCSSTTSAITILSSLQAIERTLRKGALNSAEWKPLSAARVLPEYNAPTLLSERETKLLLKKAGLPIPNQHLVTSASDARLYAKKIGFPVAMKMEAEGLAHKSDIGGVELNLSSEDDVTAAFERIEAAAHKHFTPDQIKGFLLQEFISADIEIFVGSRWDPQFGTILAVGFGGTKVELLKDIFLLATPFSKDDVQQKLAQLKLYPLLTGYRGADPIDIDELSQVIVNIGAFCAGLGARLIEFDANPILLGRRGIHIVDARAVVA